MNAEFKRRLELIKDTRQSNCIGTALYLVGLQDLDSHLSTFQVDREYLSGLSRLVEPIEGCLVAWLNNDNSDHRIISVPHMGVITIEHPPCITHRDGANGPVLVNESLARLTKYSDIFERAYYAVQN